MKDNNSVQYRAKIVHSFLNSLSKLSGKQLSKSYTNNIPKLALYIDPNNTNIIVKIRLQIQVLLVRINIQLYDLTRALQHLEIVNSMFDE